MSSANIKELSFYTRFKDDIRSGKKTITIRDESESSFSANDQVRCITNPEEEWIADVTIKGVDRISFDELNEQHALQENMSLTELKTVIRTIYPDETEFYRIHFEVISAP